MERVPLLRLNAANQMRDAVAAIEQAVIEHGDHVEPTRLLSPLVICYLYVLWCGVHFAPSFVVYGGTIRNVCVQVNTECIEKKEIFI